MDLNAKVHANERRPCNYDVTMSYLHIEDFKQAAIAVHALLDLQYFITVLRRGYKMFSLKHACE